MEIHKPKPIHTWRELLTEIGVIVIGVAIALAGEQTVEALHWHYRVNDAMEAIRLELRDDTGPQVYVRGAAAACFDKQLNGIQAAVEAGRSRPEITALIARYAPPRRTWSSNAWDSMLASGVASHLPADQMTKLGWIYTGIPLARSMGVQEVADLIALRPIRLSGQKLSTSEEDTILAALARLREANRRWGAVASGMLALLKENGIVLKSQDKDRILSDLRALYHDCVIVPAPLQTDPNEQIDATMRRAMAPRRGPQ